MSVLGCDYAWTRPDPAALVAAGIHFACRYYSHDTSKNLSLTEAKALAAHGIWCVGNWEYGAQDALRGYAGGVADATLARQQATACGQPADRPIYFSQDWDVTPTQEAVVTEYLKGADSVLGWSEVGEYAGYYPVRVQSAAGVISWEWQTIGWSGGQWDSKVNIKQTGATTTVSGVEIDLDEAMTADYGQWMPGISPGVDMTPDEHNTLYAILANLTSDTPGTLNNLVVEWITKGYEPASVPKNAPYHNMLHTKLDGLASQLTALKSELDAVKAGESTPPAVDVAALAAALEPLLQTGPTADQLAAAVMAHLSADTSKG